MACALLAAAQTPVPAPKQTPFTYQATVGEVLVQASVTDKHGRTVNDLTQANFEITENGVPQIVDSFTHEDAPVSVGILVDNSGSMYDKRAQVDQATLNFVRASNPRDEDFIVKFNDEYHLVVPFTSSIPVMVQGLGSLNPQSSTALYDSILHAVRYMNQNARRKKKVLLVITDGNDDASGHDLKPTLALLEKQDVPEIYCIGILGSDQSRSAKKESDKALNAMAAATGGKAYFPKDVSQINQVTEAVAHDIRLQYSLTYHSNQTGPGYRRIQVKVSDPHRKHLSVYTRRGYVAPDKR